MRSILALLVCASTAAQCQRADPSGPVGEIPDTALACGIELLGSVPVTGGLANNLDVVGSRAFVTTLVGLDIFDISDLADPGLAGSVHFRSAFEVDVDQEIASVVSGGLVLVEVAAPEGFRVLAEHGSGRGYTDVKKRGDYVYLSSRLSGLDIIDVSLPDSPVEVGRFESAHSYPEDWMGYLHVEIKGNTAFLAEAGRGIAVIDISDPTNPTSVFTLPEPGIRNILVHGAVLYGTTLSGLTLFDISNPTIPHIVGALSGFDLPHYLAIEEGGVVLYDETHRVHFIDTTDPANLSVTGICNQLTHDLQYVGDHLLSIGEGLEVFLKTP